MKKNKDLSLTMDVLIIAAALALALVPFTTANADSPGQQGSLAAMKQICRRTEGAAMFGCSLLPGGGSNNSLLALQQLSPQAAMQAESISITSPYQFIRGVSQQAQKLRDCDPGERRLDNTSKKRKTECNSNGNSVGGSSNDAYGFIGPFGVSFSGGGGFGDQETTDGQTGFNINTRQANLIIDYPFARDLIGGFSFGYLSTDRKLGLASGSLNSDSYRFAPFLSYTPTPNSYVTLMGGYASVDFDSTRSISPSINEDGTTITVSNATAKYGADEFFASLGAGYTWRMDAWSLRGYGRGDYSHSNIESFQESGAIASPPDGSSYASKVNGQSILSATSTLGAELSYAISTNTLAAVVIPRLRAEWVHEFENSGRQTQATFNQVVDSNGAVINASTGPIAVAGPERNWANLGVGLQMLFPHAIVGYLNYDTLFIENAGNQTVSGGVRVNF